MLDALTSWMRAHKFGVFCCLGAYLSFVVCYAWAYLAIRSDQVREQSLLLNITERGDEYQFRGDTLPSLVALGVGLAFFLAAAVHESFRRRHVDAIRYSTPAMLWYFMLIFMFAVLSESAFP